MGSALLSSLGARGGSWHVVLRYLYQGNSGNRWLDHQSASKLTLILTTPKDHADWYQSLRLPLCTICTEYIILSGRQQDGRQRLQPAT